MAISNIAPNLEQRILKAAENNDDNLMDLLQEAIERIPDDQQCELLLDKVLQILTEDMHEARGWRADEP